MDLHHGGFTSRFHMSHRRTSQEAPVKSVEDRTKIEQARYLTGEGTTRCRHMHERKSQLLPTTLPMAQCSIMSHRTQVHRISAHACVRACMLEPS